MTDITRIGEDNAAFVSQPDDNGNEDTSEQHSTTENSQNIVVKVCKEGRSQRYLQKYSRVWECQPQFADWIAPVPGNPLKAHCRFCHVKLNAHLTDLRRHIETSKHVRNALKQRNAETQSSENEPPSAADDADVGAGDDSDEDYDEHNSMMVNTRVTREGRKVRYMQRYLKAWERHPKFAKWLERVPNNPLRARCRCCHLTLLAKFTGLLQHARTSKHVQNLQQEEMKNRATAQTATNETTVTSSTHDWVATIPGKPLKVLCTFCDVELNANLKDVKRHDKTLKHARNVEEHLPSPTKSRKSTAEDGGGDESYLNVEPDENGEVNTSKLDKAKRPVRYPRKYLEEWERHPPFSAWLEPVAGNPGKAHCRCCDARLLARFTILRQHARTTKHIENEQRVFGSQKMTNGEQPNVVDNEGHQVITKVVIEGQSPRYLQKYLKAWERDPRFTGWLAPVPSDPLKARCRCCRVMLIAHFTGLLSHARTSKHVNNMKNAPPQTTSQQIEEETTYNDNSDEDWAPGSNQQAGDEEPEDNQSQALTSAAKTLATKGSNAVLWLIPVKDHPNLAKCLWCSLVTSRSYLYQHIKSAKHIRNAARFFARKDWNPDSGLESSEVADEVDETGDMKPQLVFETPLTEEYNINKYREEWEFKPEFKEWLAPVPEDIHKAMCRYCLTELVAQMSALKKHARTVRHRKLSASGGRLRFTPAPLNHSETPPASAQDEEPQMMEEDDNEVPRKKTGCFLLSRKASTNWTGKYKHHWELDPLFQGWIAPVPGDFRHARCRYCCVLLNAHRNDLLKHSRSAKHAANITFGRPCSDRDLASETIIRSLMQQEKKKQRVQQKKSRFRKPGIVTSVRPLSYPVNRHVNSKTSLLRPDDSLAAHEDLAALGLMSIQPAAPCNVTTLVLPAESSTQLDPSQLPQAEASDTQPTVYHVTNAVKEPKTLTEDNTRDIMAHMADNVTVWEFINMKVNRSLQRPSATIHLADMLNELEELHRQYRKLARAELQPIPCDTDQPCPASKILVLESDELSRVLGFEPGKYVIRGVTRNAPRVEPPPLPDGKRRPGRPRKSVNLQPSTDHQEHDLFSAS